MSTGSTQENCVIINGFLHLARRWLKSKLSHTNQKACELKPLLIPEIAFGQFGTGAFFPGGAMHSGGNVHYEKVEFHIVGESTLPVGFDSEHAILQARFDAGRQLATAVFLIKMMGGTVKFQNVEKSHGTAMLNNETFGYDGVWVLTGTFHVIWRDRVGISGGSGASGGRGASGG